MTQYEWAALAVTLMLSVPAAAHAQLPMLNGSSPRDMISRAEREGASAPRDTTTPALISRSFTMPAVQGSAARTCAQTSGIGPTRSGDFVVGGDVSSVARGANAGRKIWWSPIHHSKDMKLVVRARLLAEPSDTMRYETFPPDNVIYQASSAGNPVNERVYAFHTGPTFPKVGKWLVVATSGSDWGCFLMDMY